MGLEDDFFDYPIMKHGNDSKPIATGVGLRLSFCNMSIKIHNLPENLRQEMEELVVDKTDEIYDDKENDEFGILADTEREREKAKNTSNNSPKKAPPTTVQGGTQLGVIHEDPVLEIEKERLRHVIAFIQTHIFIRFQTRAAAKLFTSMIFLFIPFIVTFVGNSKYSPNFADPTEISTSKDSQMQLVAAITFFLVDIIELIYVSRLAIKNARDMSSKLKYFYRLIVDDSRVALSMFGWSILCGGLLFQTRWKYFGGTRSLNYPHGGHVEAKYTSGGWYKHFTNQQRPFGYLNTQCPCYTYQEDAINGPDETLAFKQMDFFCYNRSGWSPSLAEDLTLPFNGPQSCGPGVGN